MPEASPLAYVIGQQLRRARGDQTQQQIAELISRHGLRWRQSTVAETEAGHRAEVCSLGELLLLSVAFDKPLRWWVGSDLTGRVKHGEQVELPSGVVVPIEGVASLLTGADPGREYDRQQRRAKGLDIERWRVPEADKLRSLRMGLDQARGQFQAIWPGGGDAEFVLAVTASTRPAEMKAAARLGITPLALSTHAVRLWGRGLTDERERRTDNDTSAQARGHVTRELRAELRDAIHEQTPSGAKRTAKTTKGKAKQ